MLEFFRRNSSSFIVQLLFGAIVVVFVFWGMGTGTGSRQVVAEIDGKSITDSQFALAFRSEVYRQRQSRELTDADYERIKGEVIDRLVVRHLLLRTARDAGIRVSDAQLRENILGMEAFQGEGGKFSPELYRTVMKNNGTDASRFEADLREQLTIERLQTVLQRAVVVSPAEVRDAWQKANESVDLEFIRISPSQFDGAIDVSDTRVDAWLAENVEKVQAEYDRDYDKEYNKPRQVKASHVLLRVEGDDPPDLKAKVEAKAKEVHGRAATEDFEALARRYGEDHTARRGGDLGWVDDRRAGAPYGEEAFKSALASLQPGQVSDVIPTSQGFEIVKAIEVREPKVIAFDEAKREIAQKLIRADEAPRLARAFADELAGPFSRGEDVSAKLAEKDLKLQETGEFSFAQGRVPKLGASPELADAAFEMRSPGKGPQQVFEVSGSMVLARLKSRTEADASTFEEQKKETAEALRLRKQSESFQSWIDTLKAEADVKVFDVKI